jgi:hypothetical protein
VTGEDARDRQRAPEGDVERRDGERRSHAEDLAQERVAAPNPLNLNIELLLTTTSSPGRHRLQIYNSLLTYVDCHSYKCRRM